MRSGPTNVEAARSVSLRALLVGCGVGVPLTISNVYMALKTGWWDSGQITSALLGFPIVSALMRVTGGRASVFHTNLVQVTACSVAAMPAVLGLLGAVPALGMGGVQLDPGLLAGFGLALGLLGIWVAARFQDHLFVDEQLAFPTGVATAELIKTLHADRGEGARLARPFLIAAVLSLLAVMLRDGPYPLLPAVTWWPSAVFGVSATSLLLGVGWSPMMFGIGGLCGLRIASSLLAGAFLAWAVIAPQLTAGGVEATFGALGAWLLWPGVGLIAGASFPSTLRAFAAIPRLLRALRKRRPASDEASVPTLAAERLLLGVGLVALASFGHALFGLRLLELIVLAWAAPFLALVAARSAGRTDIAPLGPLGQMTQASFGLFAPRALEASVGAGQVVAGVGSEAVNALWSWRAGEILGASRRPQLIAQCVGVLVGIAVALPTYALVLRGHVVGDAAFPAPFAIQFRAIGELVAGGASTVGQGAFVAAGSTFAIGLVLELLKLRVGSRSLPDATAMGVAFLAPAHYAVSIAIGACLLAGLHKRGILNAHQVSSLCAGAIVAEAATGMVLSLFAAP